MNTESTHDPGSALREGERIFAHAWKLLALRGVIAIAFGTINIVGGFMVTDRMLGMFARRPKPKAEDEGDT